MKKILFIINIFFFAIGAYGQQNKNKTGIPNKIAQADSMPPVRNLQVIARSYGDSVVLRWAPAKATLWHFANIAGYNIIRYEVDNKKVVISTRKILSSVPIKPWTLDQWKLKAQRNDSLAAVCAQLLYGKSQAENPQKKKNEGVNLQESLNKKYELENEHALALFLADQSPFYATGLGLRYTDKSIVKGKNYAYAVFALTDPKVIKSDTSGVLINTNEIMPMPEMPQVLVEELDRKVKFTWNRVLASMYFTAYYYERSEDGGKTFKRMNKNPYTQLAVEQDNTQNSTIELNDSLPKNYKQYYYRIIGITPFGDFGKPTPDLAVMGRDRTPPSAPESISAKNIRDNDVRITWTKRIKETDFSGFLIGKGENASGPFIPLTLQLISTSVFEFTDTSAMTHGTNYYIVSAIDTAGNAGISIPAYVIMMDTIPPAKPTDLSGKVDSTGIVTIKWKPGKEPDLMGYLVYTANDPSHVFTPVSKDFVVDTTFTDSITIATLTKKIYYKVVAFDKNRNPSKYSDALELKRPDKVPPVAPVFNNFIVSDTSVVLNWVTSSSNDVVSQVLYRREQGGEWKEYVKIDVTKNLFIDTKVNKKTWYEYCLEAVDDAGLHSAKSFPLNVRVYDSGKRQEIQNFTLSKSSDGKSLLLSWKYSEKGDYWFVIYRSFNGSEMMTYKNLASDQHSFVDSNLKKGVYRYSIKAVYKDGGESQSIKTSELNYSPAN
jgi:uncharacterized protein